MSGTKSTAPNALVGKTGVGVRVKNNAGGDIIGVLGSDGRLRNVQDHSAASLTSSLTIPLSEQPWAVRLDEERREDYPVRNDEITVENWCDLNYDEQESAMADPRTPEGVLVDMAEIAEIGSAWSLLRNPALPMRGYELLVANEDPKVRALIVEREFDPEGGDPWSSYIRVPEQFEFALADDVSPIVVKNVAKNTGNQNLLVALAAHEHPDVRDEVARNEYGAVTPAALDIVGERPNSLSTRLALAGHEKSTEELREQSYNDRSPEVRMQLVLSGQVTSMMLARMTQDEDPRVATEASNVLRRIGDMAVVEHRRATSTPWSRLTARLGLRG